MQVGAERVGGPLEGQGHRAGVGVDLGLAVAAIDPEALDRVGQDGGGDLAVAGQVVERHVDVAPGPVLADPARRDRGGDEVRQRCRRHRPPRGGGPGDDGGRVGLPVGIAQGQRERLAGQVGGGLEKDDGPRAVRGVADELGDGISLLVRPRPPAEAAGAADLGRRHLRPGREPRQGEPDILHPVGPDPGAGADAVVPVLPEPRDRQRGPRHPQVRVGPPAPEIEVGAGAVVVADLEVELAAGLDHQRLDEQVGRPRPRLADQRQAPRASGRVEQPLVLAVPGEADRRDLATRRQPPQQDVDVLHVVRLRVGRGPDEVAPVLPEPPRREPPGRHPPARRPRPGRGPEHLGPARVGLPRSTVPPRPVREHEARGHHP